MRELDRRIATLRLRLAEISAREDQIRSLQRQFRGQLERLMDFAIFDRGDLDSALSMAEDVESRLDLSERTLGHLLAIKSRGQHELNALLLTSSIEAAKADIAELETRLNRLDEEIEGLGETATGREPATQVEGEDRLVQLRAQHDQVLDEIRRLRQDISEASDAAARTVSERTSQASPGAVRPGPS